MPTIRYPIPYQLYGHVGKNKKPQVVDIADELTFEIQEVDAGDAPVAVSVMKEWPVGIFQSEFDKFRSTRPPAPLTMLRSLGNALYAPIFKIGKNVREPSPLRAEEFDQVFNQVRVATPMAHLYANHNYEALGRYFAGTVRTLDAVKITSLADRIPDNVTVEGRNFIVDRATKDAEGLIAINGELWRRQEREPVIRYQLDRGMVELVIDNGESFPRSSTVGYFRLNRLEDCLEHVRNTFPGKEISQQFRIVAIDGDALHYADEEATLTWAAGHLERQVTAVVADLTGAGGLAYYDLKELNAGKGEIDYDALADKMTAIIDAYPESVVPPHEVVIALDRWKMRPIEIGGYGL